MKLMSKELLGILSPAVREQIKKLDPLSLQEIRLKTGCQALARSDTGIRQLGHIVLQEDINFVINTASRYSPWNARTAAQGYITAPGGHRIGICGEGISDQGRMQGIRNPSSVCIRVAKEIPGLSDRVDLRESLLIIGPPGSGKTTLLRDLIRRISKENRGMISVVDERGEIFPHTGGKSCFDSGNADVLSNCSKPEGIEMVLRSMGPQWIAVDEITAQTDCDALVQAGWCGVKLLATVHAGSAEDLRSRPVYRPLMDSRLFRTGVLLSKDRQMERVVL